MRTVVVAFQASVGDAAGPPFLRSLEGNIVKFEVAP